MTSTCSCSANTSPEHQRFINRPADRFRLLHNARGRYAQAEVNIPSLIPDAEPARSFFQRPPWSRRWFWVLLSLLILEADFLCGPRLLFPILFTFPVILAGWNCARRDAVLIALFLTVARLGFSFMWEQDTPTWADVVNAVVRGAVLVSLGVLVSRVAAQNAQLARRLKRLEGLLPICAHCKKILDEDRHWIRLETYIAEHSQAEFSHGICPDCARVHLGVNPPNESAF